MVLRAIADLLSFGMTRKMSRRRDAEAQDRDRARRQQTVTFAR